MTQTSDNTNKTYEHVFRSDNSLAMRLSNETIQHIGFEIGDTVEVQKINGDLFVTKKETSVEDGIKKFYQNGGKYDESEVNFGKSVGREI
ncbi:AbrB family transcriptional regulator [Staphylococcus ursi]|uniref:AbrB/MazE/SpoVT family DNA-binding domain-containing protein n=1 Tax=Staphylococcus sp. MI 10-1553 TaxID=1912064 RepID=UPI001398FE66|nr:AbrB family transcriptional regulator [Staphylococcus sp. MI 10-1553]QHW37996.1 AbrB family transcriptional regulator [Staphylococcus sp. MI 10-1553]